MNKRYMDFVPSKGAKLEEKKPEKRPVVAPVKSQQIVRSMPSAAPVKPVAKPMVKGVPAKPVTVAKPVIKPASQPSPKKESVESKDDVRLGVIEDLGAVEGLPALVEKPVENRKIQSSKTFTVPKSPFINQNKVEKRPLSKNVYQKKVTAPKEEPKGPVTIIAKPEKDAHVSIVVAVILTIILGAAAGTVAFLLLPK